MSERNPPTRLTRRGFCRVLVTSAALALGPGWTAVLASDAYDERRMRTGAKLFRALLAADEQLSEKTTSDGGLEVLVYGRDAASVEEAKALIGAPDAQGRATLKGMDLHLRSLGGLPGPDGRRPVGLFLAEPPDEALLDELIDWGIREHVIVYSPFEGHVERGALGGVAIEAKVRPYINRRTMQAANVQLKPFFLKVSKVHE